MPSLSLSDLATPAGIAALAILITQVMKNVWYNPSWPHFGLISNLTTIAAAFVCGVASKFIPGIGVDTWSIALGNAALGYFFAVGGYEPVANTIKAITNKDKSPYKVGK